jgi:hypothetical protein
MKVILNKIYLIKCLVTHISYTSTNSDDLILALFFFCLLCLYVLVNTSTIPIFNLNNIWIQKKTGS